MNKILYAGILAMLLLGTMGITVQAISDKDQKLIDAAVVGDVAKVKKLIAEGADVNAKDNFGQTVLMWAACRGHIEIAKLLIESGADVNAKDSTGDTALIFAASEGHLETVKILIESGADVNAKNMTGGVTALKLAAGIRVILK